MREFQERNKQRASINRIVNSKWFLAILIILILLLIRGNIRVFKNYFHVRGTHSADREHLDALQKRDRALDADLYRIETDIGRDYEIRKKLDVAKPEERVIKIIDKK